MGGLDLAIEEESKIKLACVQWCGFFSIFQHNCPMPIKSTMICGMYLEREMSMLPSVTPGPQPAITAENSEFTALTSATLRTVPLFPDWHTWEALFGQPEVLPNSPFATESVCTSETPSVRGMDTPSSSASRSEVGSDYPPPAYQS